MINVHKAVNSLRLCIGHLHFEIDSEDRLRAKLYDKRDHFNFPFVNFLFICSNIPAAPAYGVNISQLIRYSRACSSYQDFLVPRERSLVFYFVDRWHFVLIFLHCDVWLAPWYLQTLLFSRTSWIIHSKKNSTSL